jgi:hypothetical protein
MNIVPMSKLSSGAQYHVSNAHMSTNFDMIETREVKTVRERDVPAHKLDKNDRMLLNRMLRAKDFRHGKIKSVCYKSGDTVTRQLEHQGFVLLVIESTGLHSRVTFNRGVSNIYRDFDKLMMYIEYLTGLKVHYSFKHRAIVHEGFPIDGRSIHCDLSKQINRITGEAIDNFVSERKNRINETIVKQQRRERKMKARTNGYPPF